jgi:hypothetical protein
MLPNIHESAAIWDDAMRTTRPTNPAALVGPWTRAACRAVSAGGVWPGITP